MYYMNEKEKDAAAKQAYSTYATEKKIGYLDPVAESRLLSQIAVRIGTMEGSNVPARL